MSAADELNSDTAAAAPLRDEKHDETHAAARGGAASAVSS